MGAKQKKRQQRQHLFRQARMLANAWLDEGVSRAKAVAATAATAVTGEAALRATECPLLHAVVSLGSLVGQGGMSKVYLVPNLGLNDLQGGQWVVKEVHMTPDALAQFDSIGEIEMLMLNYMGVYASSTAPVLWNLVPTTKGATLYLVMHQFDMSLLEYLQQHVHKDGDRRVDVAQMVRVIIQVCHQLTALHQRGMTHGDLKLGNILVRVCPYTHSILDARASDWGTLVHQGGDEPVPSRVGTYVPERDSDGYFLASRRSDMYNVGRMLLECLLGPQVLLVEGDMVPALTDLSWVAGCSAAELCQAAEEQGSSAASAEWACDSRISKCLSVLGAEMGLCGYGDRGLLARKRAAQLLAPGAQSSYVTSALRTLLPLCQSLLTLKEQNTSASYVAAVLEGVLVGMEMPRCDMWFGYGLLTLTAPLFPTCDDHQLELARHTIPDALGYGITWLTPERVVQQQQQQQVPQQHQQPLSYDHKLWVFKKAGWVVSGHMVYGPSGQQQLISEPVPEEALAAAAAVLCAVC